MQVQPINNTTQLTWEQMEALMNKDGDSSSAPDASKSPTNDANTNTSSTQYLNG